MSEHYNKLWPNQARAKWLVQTYVQRGKIVKPDCCQKCAEPFPPARLQAHHHDYDKPLEVSWYCQKCHTAVHKELGRHWKEWKVTQVIETIGDLTDEMAGN